MYDPNIKDFYERVGRLQKAHASGLGFESVGTLGRSYYYRPQRKRRSSFLAPLCFLAMAVFGVKGTIHYHIGEQTYQARVASMQDGEGFDRLGATIMAEDPVTVWVSGVMRKYLARQA